MGNSREPVVLFMPSVGSNMGIGSLLRCLTITNVFRGRAKSIFCLEERFLKLKSVFMHNVLCIPEDRLGQDLNSCDAVVFDKQGPIRACAYFQKLKQLYAGVPIIAMDYFYRDASSVDVMINLSDHSETDWPGGKRHIEYYEGLDYAVIRPAFLKVRPRKASIVSGLQNVLVTFGGEDAREWTIKSILWMEQHIERKLDVKVIIGALNESIDSLEKIIQGPVFHRYSLMQHARDIEVHARNADLVFCGGGTTILEMAFLGKAVVALPQHDMERIFLKKLEKRGFLLSGLEECIDGMSKYPIGRLFDEAHFRLDLSEIGMGIVDGKGAERVADIVLNQALAFQGLSC